MTKLMKKAIQKIQKSRKGVSLVEIIVTIGIIVIVFAGLIQVFLYSSVISEMAGNITLTISEAQSKLEEIRGHDFDSITTDYGSGGTPGNTFSLALINGMGVIYITTINSDLLLVEIVVSWREKNNRIMGEDTNLNGVLNSGEDANSNGKLDSSATIVTLIAKRN